MPSRRERFAIFERDNFTCQYCGRSAPSVVIELDHIIPICRNGKDAVSNYTTACYDCNRGKRGFIPLQLRLLVTGVPVRNPQLPIPLAPEHMSVKARFHYECMEKVRAMNPKNSMDFWDKYKVLKYPNH